MKILIVEDDDIFASVLDFKVKNLTGGNTYVVDSGEDCLFFAQQNNYDLIIIDHYLKGFSGLETLKKLRKNDNLTPVIVVSNQTNVDIISEYKNIGCLDYIKKGKDPFTHVGNFLLNYFNLKAS